MPRELPIIVFSHLRWDFVYQRPQHLLSRLAQQRRVIFIEEPTYDKGCQPYIELRPESDNLIVCKPHVPRKQQAFGIEQTPTLVPLVHQLLQDQGIDDYVVWLYTPMALPLAQTLRPQAVVYDCMDELSAFKDAPPALLNREAELLGWADVVFTGGPSLYRAKQGRHHNVHCLPSSVDAAHFRQALSIEEAAGQSDLPHPRLGFYGVIDERMDFGILEAMAQAHPEWQIVMVGPVVKIDPDSLPTHPNLHFLGQKSYAELPSYLAGWDVCLLPFAQNESTRFISPTKTLEYMAAELPIVSTPIRDVAEPYGDIVYLGDTPQAFIAACEQALAASPGEREARIKAGRAVLALTSWDRTAQQMEIEIDKAIEKRTVLLAPGNGALISTNRTTPAMQPVNPL
ncbi:MAG TPA: glycosyltransferase family 1 protein [Chloroflexia bacterium]|nr:glycosyltransferase family 1 protein [Chloroflexia bacterium]